MRMSSPALRRQMATLVGMLLSVISQMIWWSSPAESQSFLQQLFGMAPPPQLRHTLPPQRLDPRAVAIPLYMPPQSPRSGDDWSKPRTTPSPEGSGSYTTVCVRMCDGFHFPISYKVQRSRFYRDADICRSRCGMADSRLFYHPSTGSNANMNSAVDLTGRSYADLPIAFLHRKRLVSGCTCRPEPWSEASANRHERYAAAENPITRDRNRAATTGLPTEALTVVAGNYSQPAKSKGNTSALLVSGPDGLDSNDDKAVTADVSASNSSSSDDQATPTPTPEAVALTKRRPAKSVATSTNSRSATRLSQTSPRTTVSRGPVRPVVATAPPRKSKGTTIASAAKLTWPGDAR